MNTKLTFTMEEDVRAGAKVEVNPETGMLRAARPFQIAKSDEILKGEYPNIISDLVDQEYRKAVEQENSLLRNPEWREGKECEQWGGLCPEILRDQFHLHSVVDPRTVYYPPKGSHYYIKNECYVFANSEGMGLPCRIHKKRIVR